MDKKTSNPKIDSAYYFIGAFVVAILGYYYYVNYYQNGINLKIYGYVLINASENITSPTMPSLPNPPSPTTQPIDPLPTPEPAPMPDPPTPAPTPGPGPPPSVPHVEVFPTMPVIPPFTPPSEVTQANAPLPPAPKVLPKPCSQHKCASHRKLHPQASSKNGTNDADCCVDRMCNEYTNCPSDHLRKLNPERIAGTTTAQCCVKMNVSSGWHRIHHKYYDGRTVNLFQNTISSDECSKKCHAKGNYVFSWNMKNNTCYCKNDLKQPKNSSGQGDGWVSGRFGDGAKLCEHNSMKGKCQTFTTPGKYNMNHAKMAGNPRECETTPAARRFVALYNDHWKRFVKIEERRVIMSPTTEVPSLPGSWHSERFELVPAQDGQFALYNHKYKNYLRMPGRDKDMDGSDRQNKHSRIPDNQMGWERFQFIPRGGGQYAIKCPYSTGGPSYMRAGGHHVNGAPHIGAWEQFRIIDANCRVGFNDSFSSALVYPGYTVGLYENDNFEGKNWWIGPGQRNELGDHADRASSIIVRRDTL